MKFLLKSSLLLLLLSLFFPQNAKGQTPPIEPSELSRSDIPFSVRWWKPRLPDDQSITDPTSYWFYNPNAVLPNGLNGKADQFYANRFLWTYDDLDNDDTTTIKFPLNASNYATVRSTQYAIPLYIDTDNFTGTPEEIDLELGNMIATNLCDRPLRSIWEIQQNWFVNRPDYNSSEYLDYQIIQVKKLVNHGNISFQQDDSGGNVSSVDYGGSFSASSMTKFNTWVLNNNNVPTELQNELSNYDDLKDYLRTKLSLPIPSEDPANPDLTLPNRDDYPVGEVGDDQYQAALDNYQAAYSLYDTTCNCHFADIYEATEDEINDTNVLPVSKLKYFFREFQKDMMIDYYTQLHNSIDSYIFTEFETQGTYSANNTERNEWLAPAFDFWISELYPKDNEIGLVYDVFEISRFLRSAFFEDDDSKKDVVSSITVARTQKKTNRTSIALSYASGLTMIAPWDVYIAPFDGPQPRFYGDSNDYDDLLSFINSNNSLFDNFNIVEEHNYSFLNYYDEVQSVSDVYIIDGSGNSVVDNTRDRVGLLRNKKLLNISNESRVKIGNTEYTVTQTTDGSIYVPKGSVQIGEPVYYVKLYHANTDKYSMYFDDSYRVERSANMPDVDITTGFVTSVQPRVSPVGKTIYWTDQGSLDIPVGSIVGINGSEYTTNVETGVGNIYLPSSANINVGDTVWYIINPHDPNDPYDDIQIYPTEDKPFAVTYRNQDNYVAPGTVNWTNTTLYPDRTFVVWTGMAQQPDTFNIPKGSKVLINDNLYTTVENTTNGSLYLASEEYIPKSTFKNGDSVWYIKDDKGSIIYPNNKIYNDGVMHIVNLDDSPTKVAVKVKKNLFPDHFGKVYSPDITTFQNTEYIDAGLYHINILNNNLDKWAILKQGNGFGGITVQNLTTSSDEVLVYPNPNDGTFTIKLPDQYTNSNINIYNSVGLLVYKNSEATALTNVSMSGLSSGIYIVQIKMDGEYMTKKIIMK
ncbi:T9SS type A sorting domain-containing protein [uncultured Winogradskyella sp.]|uniref:T9SS type A sorting domain-containing protein n=1 Tax=uncultured Winogradskyella sp. TaxID=395353 RepID=UPI002616B09A|nr:T9SS type A sorting domain-containing protein [uncultured Winogradskyella sp.]